MDPGWNSGNRAPRPGVLHPGKRINAMKSSWICAGLAALALCCPLAVQAADQEAGVPLSPAEAGGVWTLESAGHDICTVTLAGEKAAGAGGYLARSDRSCAEVFEGAPVAWGPTADGMQLLGMDGRTLIAFSRWSNSLFVSHRSSGVDVQLRRGKGRAVGAVN
jgi:hypothetical protein